MKEDAAIFDRATGVTTYRLDDRVLTKEEALAYLHSRAVAPAAAREKLQALPMVDSGAE